MSTLTIESNTYLSTVPTPLYCLSSLEFPREAFLDLCYSYYSSMTFLNMYCTPYHYCSQMTPNVCPPYHLLLTVNFYNLISTSSPTGVLSGGCSSMSPNAHCCPSVQTITAVPTSFLTTSTIVKSLHVLITRISASQCLVISPGLCILLKSLPKHIVFLVCSVELSQQPTASQPEKVYIFPWSAHNCSMVLRFGDLS